jgi:hypothetical protein
MNVTELLEWLDRQSKGDHWTWAIEYDNGYTATLDGDTVCKSVATFEEALNAITDRINEALDFKYDERG